MGRHGMKLLALILLCACAHGALTPPARAGDPGARLVAVQWHSPLPEAWRRSPWYRWQSDVTTPMRIIVSTDAYGCLDVGVEDPQPGSYYVCRTGWRYPQERGP
jgi:hypothetical protein